MKKTLVAIALAVTTVSGSAMAWTASGTGGNLEIGGNIQVNPYDTPWEVEVGASVMDMSASINKGNKIVAIPVTKAIPVLGIRTTATTAFTGATGLNPQIDYGNAVDLASFNAGKGQLSLPLMNAADPTVEIGKMKATIVAAAGISHLQGGVAGSGSLFAANANEAFYGGLGQSESAIVDSTQAALTLAQSISPDYVAKFDWQGASSENKTSTGDFGSTDTTFSGFYGAGLQSGTSIILELTKPAETDTVNWKASLPITVSYQ